VVISACTSMYSYFSSFYRGFTRVDAERKDLRESAVKLPY
jgi:hypothetical protein